MQNFLTIADHTREELDGLIHAAMRLKANPGGEALRGKSVALLFLNPSLRTRASFQIGVQELGGFAVVLEPGKGSWGIEFEPGAVMEGDAEEHIAEVAQVLSRYCDIIALRAFPPFKNWRAEREDPVIRALARHANVPVINMETIVHPCQALAMMMTIRERLGKPHGRKFLLTWTWHPKPLNTAVANSALMMAARFGMDITLLIPEPEYALDDKFVSVARADAQKNQARFEIVHDIEAAYAGAEFVYAKSWGALPFHGDPVSEWKLRERFRHFIVDEEKMALTNNALFSHCLPLRRNVKATDGVMDAEYCVAIDEAENRLHVQKAVMARLVSR